MVFDHGIRSVEGWRIDGAEYGALVPLLHLLGALTDYDPVAQRVRAEMDGRIWVFWGQSAMVGIDGEAAGLGRPVVLHKGELAVPVEGLARLLDRYTGMSIVVQGSRLRITNRETTILGFDITRRRNGIMVELPLSAPAPCEAYLTEGNWVNVLVHRARIRSGGLSATDPARPVREIRSVQFDSSAQVSIRFRDPVERFLAIGQDNPPRVTLLVGDTAQWAPSAVVSPPAGPFGSPDNPIEVIVLDPAHGGRDLGGIGPRDHTQEKDVTLAIAEQAARLFERDPRFTVVLTREDDSHLDAGERAGIAHEAGADLLISIHAAAAGRISTRGCQTFFGGRRSGSGAADFAEFEATEDLETIFPASDDGGITELGWSGHARQSVSARLAELVQQNLESEIKLPSRGVDRLRLDILSAVGIPAIVVNCGFISHPEDEEMLRKKSFQKDAARAIYEAVCALRAEIESRQPAAQRR